MLCLTTKDKASTKTKDYRNITRYKKNKALHTRIVGGTKKAFHVGWNFHEKNIVHKKRKLMVDVHCKEREWDLVELEKRKMIGKWQSCNNAIIIRIIDGNEIILTASGKRCSMDGS